MKIEDEAELGRRPFRLSYVVGSRYENDDLLPNHTAMYVLTVSDVLSRVGNGLYQYLLGFVVGFCGWCYGLELLLLCFLASCAKDDFHMTPWQQGLLTSSSVFGQVGGALLLGPIGDMYGRRTAFFVSACCVGGFGLFSALAINLWQLIFCRVVVGVGVGGLGVPFDLLSEMLHVNHKGSILVLVQFSWTLSSIVLTGAAWVLMGGYGLSWRWLALLSAVPALLLLGCFVYVPESIRWLLVNGRAQEAEETLRRMAACNGQTLPSSFSLHSVVPPHKEKENKEEQKEEQKQEHKSGLLSSLPSSSSPAIVQRGRQILSHVQGVNEAQQVKEGHIEELFKHNLLFVSLSLWLAWLCVDFVYFGSILFATRLLEEQARHMSKDNVDDVVNDPTAATTLVLTSSAGTAGCAFHFPYLFFTSCSEACMMALFFLAGGLASPKTTLLSLLSGTTISLAFLALSVCRSWQLASLLSPYAFTIFAFFSRGFAYCSSCQLWIILPELYPTRIRATAHCFAFGMACVGGSLGGFWIDTADFNSIVTAIGLLCMSLIGILGVMTLPSAWEDRGMDNDASMTSWSFFGGPGGQSRMNRIDEEDEEEDEEDLRNEIDADLSSVAAAAGKNEQKPDEGEGEGERGGQERVKEREGGKEEKEERRKEGRRGNEKDERFGRETKIGDHDGGEGGIEPVKQAFVRVAGGARAAIAGTNTGTDAADGDYSTAADESTGLLKRKGTSAMTWLGSLLQPVTGDWQ